MKNKIIVEKILKYISKVLVLIWDIIKDDLPELNRQLAQLYRTL